MKKRMITLATMGLLIVVCVGIFAFGNISGVTESKVTTERLKLKLIGDLGNEQVSGGQDETTVVELDSAPPGGTVAASGAVALDSGQGSLSFYTRVAIHKKWLDEKNQNLSPEKIKLNLNIGKDWVVLNEDKEQVVLYYSKPLNKTKTNTSVFIKGISTAPDAGDIYTDARVQLEIDAYAVQAADVKAAIKSEWGLIAEIDSKGVLHINQDNLE